MNKLLHLIAFVAILTLLAVPYECDRSAHERTITDSIYTVRYIDSIAITEPEHALAVIDTAERLGLLEPFRINCLRCQVYHNGLSEYNTALKYGLEAYHMPQAREDAEIFLNLLELIADEYYVNGDYVESISFCTEGLQMAEDSLQHRSAANFHVALAGNLLELERPGEAFSHYIRAVDILQEEARKSKLYVAADDYVFALGMFVNALCDERRFEEAARYLPRVEQAIGSLESKEFLPDGLVDIRRASGYAMFAYIFANTGDRAKAAELYRRLCATAYSDVPDARGSLHVPYLLAVGRYSDALPILKEEDKLWKAGLDTVSYDYIDSHLRREVEAYEGIGDIRAANGVYRSIVQLNDTLRHRDRQALALELAEIYKTNEQALKIERQSASISMRNTIIISAAVFLILAALFIERMLRYNRTVSKKNRAMIKTIEELIGYKDKVSELQEELIRQRSLTSGDIAGTPTAEAEALDGAGISPAAPAPSELTHGDRMLFDRMNHEILARRLFLNPDFSKTFLIAEFRIPAYKFSAFFKEYAGCTFSQYIHNCRLDYAVRLMRENSSWSLEAIAKAARMSTSSFYSQFKKRFGMSPADFRSGESAADVD